MKQLKQLFASHLFLIWIVGGSLFAFIIHCLYSISAPNEWFVAKWSAGDMLTFTSTAALGLLAVWQNKRFKRENDIAQGRLENLTKRANELSSISKIIEHESDSIARLRAKMQKFTSECSTEAILNELSDIVHQPGDFRKTFLKIKMDNRSKQIRLCTIELLIELKTHPNSKEVIELLGLISKYSEYSTTLTQKIRTMFSADGTDDICEDKTNTERELIVSFSNFISNRETLLEKVIFGHLTLEQIKSMYSKYTK